MRGQRAPFPSRALPRVGAAAPDVDAGEQQQPHHVDEVPVLGDELEAEMLGRLELAGHGAAYEGVKNQRVATSPTHQMDLMPANLITRAHLAVSVAMNSPKSGAEPGSAIFPVSMSRAFSLPSARPALISVFR